MTLPLDTWRAFLGLSPWHFWGLADSRYAPVQSKCSTLTFEYDWQGSDAAGRASIREAILEAEAQFLAYVGFRAAPAYAEATVDWPRHAQTSLLRGYDVDATWRRIAVAAPEGYVLAMGIEQLTWLGTVAVALTTQPNTTLLATFALTITVPAGTDPAALAVYVSAPDRIDDPSLSDRWRIEPIQVSVNGTTATISGRAWLIVRPALYEYASAGPAQAIDPTDANSFVSTLDVYLRATNGDGASVSTSQATLVYESGCAGWGVYCCDRGTASTDPGAIGQVIARVGIRDSVLGLVTPGAAVYDPAAGTWSSAWCCSGVYCDPDRVTLRYLAGYPLALGQMARPYQHVIARLAAANLKRRICACRETNEKLHDLQQDLALQATETERYQVAPEDLSNPFGTRRGHVMAWRAVRYDILRRGFSV